MGAVSPTVEMLGRAGAAARESLQVWLNGDICPGPGSEFPSSRAARPLDVDAFFAGSPASRGPEQDEREVAKEFLSKALADGPKAAATLKSQGEARAISASTLDRARKDLGVITSKHGKVWFWALPND